MILKHDTCQKVYQGIEDIGTDIYRYLIVCSLKIERMFAQLCLSTRIIKQETNEARARRSEKEAILDAKEMLETFKMLQALKSLV